MLESGTLVKFDFSGRLSEIPRQTGFELLDTVKFESM